MFPCITALRKDLGSRPGNMKTKGQRLLPSPRPMLSEWNNVFFEFAGTEAWNRVAAFSRPGKDTSNLICLQHAATQKRAAIEHGGTAYHDRADDRSCR